MDSEKQWNLELIDLLESDLKKRFPNIKLKKGKVLRDICCLRRNGKYELELGFFDQDIVIYEDEIDLSDLPKVDNIKVRNIDHDCRNSIWVPRIIIELKYNGVTTHGLITYSSIARDIKTIFPNCKYLFVLRYKKTSSDEKLKRNGLNFDNIIYLDSGSAKDEYKKGDFKSDLENDSGVSSQYQALLKYITDQLEPSKSQFLK